MPKKGQSQNYDALGSIFNFLFEQSKQPPDKRRPIPITGESGNDALTGMIATALTRPAAFITETSINEFNSILDVELAKVKFDRNGEDITIKSSNLINLIKDPAGFVDKVIKDNDAARKANRAKFLGEVMDDFITTSWAYKFGNKDVQSAAVANSVANQKAETYKIARSVGQYARSGVGDAPAEDLDFMSERSLQLLGRETFGQGWDTLRKDEKDEFILVVSGGGGDAIARQLNQGRGADPKGTYEEIKNYLDRKYNPNTANNFERALRNLKVLDEDKVVKRIVDVPKSVVSIFNPSVYKTLEQENLTQKINNLSGAAPGSDQENEKRMYEKTRLLLMMDSHGKNQINLNIDSLKRELASTTDRDRRKELKRQIKDSQQALRVMDTRGIFAGIGKLEGTINSFKATKETFGENGSNIVPSVFSGAYFRDDKNRYNPIEKNTVGGVDILLAKKSKHKGIIGKINDQYNQIGENIYYMTPRSILRTIFYNGEGFARLLHRNLGSLNKSLPQNIAQLGVSMKGIEKAFNEKSGNDLNLFIQNTLASLRGSPNIRPEDLLKIEKLLKRAKTFKTLTDRFSFTFKIQSAAKKAFAQQLKKARVAFAKMLLKNKGLRDMLVKTGGSKLLGQWIAGGGIKVLVKSLVTAVAGAVGLVGTPIASFLIMVGTAVATDVLLKMAKGALVVMKYVTMGMIAIVVLLFLSASGEVSKFNKKNFTYGNVIPDTVVQCTAYEEEPVIGNIGDPGDIGDFDTQCVNGDTIEDIYARVASEMGLGTQLELVSCPGHDMCASIDWAWCYSASKIFCRADKLATVLYDCSILERLFIHELMHQIQSINGAPYDVDLREWGADYVSGNGGSYMFSTRDGCMRATQVPMLPSCTPEILKSIAYAEPEGYATQCKSELRSYILSRFCN